MLKEVKRYFYRILHPKLVALISTMDEKGVPNACTAAWVMPVSINPPLIVVALQKRHKSTHNILKTEEFVANIPRDTQIELARDCGSYSGWEIDKFKKFSIQSENSRKVKAPRITGCVAYLECKLHSHFEAGDHYLFVGEVLLAEADEKYFDNMWNEEPPLLYHFGGDVYGKVRRG